MIAKNMAKSVRRYVNVLTREITNECTSQRNKHFEGKLERKVNWNVKSPGVDNINNLVSKQLPIKAVGKHQLVW